MSLKERLVSDIDSTFLNSDEFATIHNIDGKDMLILLDDDKLMQRGDKSGLTLGDEMFFARASDFDSRPKVGQKLVLDRRSLYVSECIENFGMYQITVEQVRS